MKTCLPIVLYDSTNYNNIIELSAILLNGERITLCVYDEIDYCHPYPHLSLKEVQDMVVRWLKCNNLKPRKRFDFGCTYYDIIWIDISDPLKTNYRLFLN